MTPLLWEIISFKNKLVKFLSLLNDSSGFIMTEI